MKFSPTCRGAWKWWCSLPLPAQKVSIARLRLPLKEVQHVIEPSIQAIWSPITLAIAQLCSESPIQHLQKLRHVHVFASSFWPHETFNLLFVVQTNQESCM